MILTAQFPCLGGLNSTWEKQQDRAVYFMSSGPMSCATCSVGVKQVIYKMNRTKNRGPNYLNDNYR